MNLTIVGCSGSTSGPDSPASCYLVQAPYEGRTFSLVVDLGPGAFGALYRYLQPSDVDALALSHLHPDHCLDLCAYHVAAQYSPTSPWPRRPLYGPPGTAERIARAYEVSEPAEALTSFEHRTWQPQQRIGPFDVAAVRVNHPVETYALRIAQRDGSATLVYSGDTGPGSALAELATGADVLLVEAAFLDRRGNPPDLHLNGREAAQVAEAAGVGSLVLTHIPPWHDRDDVRREAEPHFARSITAAVAGLQVPVGDAPVGRAGDH